MKICPRCQKPGQFTLDKRTQDGLCYYCKDCKKELNKGYGSWYARNKELGREQRRNYYSKHKDEMNARVRDNYAQNKTERGEQIKNWKKANPLKVKLMSIQRRATKRGARGFATDAQIQARIDLFGGLCAYCGEREYEHLDHVIPLSRGGTCWPSNIRPACSFCNLSKGDRVWFLVKFGPIKKRLALRVGNEAMCWRERSWRESLDSRCKYDLLTQLENLARRFGREEILRPDRICGSCFSVLEYFRGKYYCDNGCEIAA